MKLKARRKISNKIIEVKGQKSHNNINLSASATVLPCSVKVIAPSKRLTSHDIFLLCIERSKNLIKVHELCHGKQAKPQKYLSDTFRGSIILSISALDAFLRTFMIDKIRELLADRKTELNKCLAEEIKRYLKDDGLLEAARKDDLLDRVGKAFEDVFGKKSFEGTKNITEFMHLLGYNDIFHNVAKEAKMNEESLRADLDKYTNRRHIIAHRGDYDLSQNPPKQQVITKKEAIQCIRLVTKIAKHINTLGEKS